MNNKASKKLVYKLLKAEIKEHGIKVEVLPLTNLENIYEIIKDSLSQYSTDKSGLRNLLLEIKKEIQTCQLATGCCNSSKSKIKILLENFKKYVSTPEQHLWALVHTTYHEYKHIIIYHEEFANIISLNYFYLLIEQLVKYLSDYYIEAHDDFYEEILANRYATKKTIKFLKENEPDTYKKLEIYIKTFALNEEIYYQNYDVQLFINYINKIIKGRVNKSILFTNDSLGFIISTLYNEDGTLKDIQTIFNNDYWNNLPKEAKYLIISSEAYLEDFDYENATTEELIFILESIDYILATEKKRQINNEQLRKKIKTLISQLAETDIYYLRSKLVLLPKLSQKENANKKKIKYLEEQKRKIIEELTSKINPPKKRNISIDSKK